MALSFTNYAWNLPKLDGVGYDTRITDISPRLAVGDYATAKISFELVYPRPDSETQSYEYNRIAYPGMPYRCPVGAKGGPNPHWYKLVSGPAGMTMGTEYDPLNDADYGVVEWLSPTTGTHEVIVRIIHPDFGATTARWSIVVGTSNHVFVDGVSGSDTTGDGTIGNPYQTIDKVFIDASTTPVNTDKTIVLRSGATATVYTKPAGYELRLGNSIGKPLGIMGHYGDPTKPQIDASLSKHTFADKDGNFLVNLDFIASPGDNSGIKDSKYLWIVNCFNRGLVFENKFDNMVPGDSITWNVHTGTASGAQTDATGYAIGASVIGLAATGTGSLDTNDRITFAGDSTIYRITSGDADVSNGGSITITPNLVQAIPAAQTAISFTSVTVGNDNPAAVFSSGAGTMRKYFFIGHNTSDNSSNSILQLYEIEKSLSRLNKYRNASANRSANGDYGFQFKDDIRDMESVFDEAWDNVSTVDQVFKISLQEGLVVQTDINVVFGKFANTAENGAKYTSLILAYLCPIDANTRNVYLTRCTFHGGMNFPVLDRSCVITYDSCIAVTDYVLIPGPGPFTNMTINDVNNLKYTVGGTPLDASFNLPSSDPNFGTHGANIRVAV